MDKLLSYKVENIRVIDGDTIEVDIFVKKEDIRWNIYSEGNFILKKRIVRLHKINAPEIFGREKLLGITSKNFLYKMIVGRECWLEVGSRKFEKFGRILGILWIIDEKGEYYNANEKMIDSGNAKPALILRGKYCKIK